MTFLEEFCFFPSLSLLPLFYFSSTFHPLFSQEIVDAPEKGKKRRASPRREIRRSKAPTEVRIPLRNATGGARAEEAPFILKNTRVIIARSTAGHRKQRGIPIAIRIVRTVKEHEGIS